jgi:hypothetical protein
MVVLPSRRVADPVEGRMPFGDEVDRSSASGLIVGEHRVNGFGA